MAKFLIVEARFYDHLNDMLVAGARAALEAEGHKVDVITVPGALEVPAAIRDRVFGHQQVTDALLLAMAVQRGGKLATFDRRVENLAGKDAAVRSAIEVIGL